MSQGDDGIDAGGPERRDRRAEEAGGGEDRSDRGEGDGVGGETPTSRDSSAPVTAIEAATPAARPSPNWRTPWPKTIAMMSPSRRPSRSGRRSRRYAGRRNGQ